MRNSDFTKNLYLKKDTDTNEMDAVNAMGLPIDNDGYTYAFVFFRQQKDTALRRGYFQKALVLQSPHCWPGLFLYIVNHLGPKVMDSPSNSDIRVVLEKASKEISRWSSPPSCWSSEKLFHSIDIPLSFFNSNVVVSFPPHSWFPQLYELKLKKNAVSIICNPGKFYQIFCRSLEVLWPCWELMTLGEPILVMSDSPTACSEVVLSLVELIKPVI